MQKMFTIREKFTPFLNHILELNVEEDCRLRVQRLQSLQLQTTCTHFLF